MGLNPASTKLDSEGFVAPADPMTRVYPTTVTNTPTAVFNITPDRPALPKGYEPYAAHFQPRQVQLEAEAMQKEEAIKKELTRRALGGGNPHVSQTNWGYSPWE